MGSKKMCTRNFNQYYLRVYKLATVTDARLNGKHAIGRTGLISLLAGHLEDAKNVIRFYKDVVLWCVC